MSCKNFYLIGVLAVLLLRAMPAGAWGTDPLRVAAWQKMKIMQTAALRGNGAAMVANAEMKHLLTEDQTKLINLQRTLNDYLDNFHDVLVVGAEVVGVGYELWRTKENVARLMKLLGDPSYLDNALAVQLSVNRNSVYVDLITNASALVNVINGICFKSKAKMSENEKYKLAFSLRPKLRRLNDTLVTLEHYVRYTTLLTVWDEIIDRAYGYKRLSTKTICIRACMRWRTSAVSHMVSHRFDHSTTVGQVSTTDRFGDVNSDKTGGAGMSDSKETTR